MKALSLRHPGKLLVGHGIDLGAQQRLHPRRGLPDLSLIHRRPP